MKSVLSLLLLTIALPAAAQERDSFSGLVEDEQVSGQINRTVRAQTGLAPLTSRILLNGTRINLDDRWIFDLTGEAGSGRNGSLSGEANYVIRSQSDQRIAFVNGGSRYEQEQTSWVFQLRAMDSLRRTRTTRVEGGDLLGFKLDLSITGQCFLPGTDPDGYCTYTPGLATSPELLDENFIPYGFLVGADFGSSITQADHDSLKEEGFQRGNPDNAVGLALDVPNAGFAATQAGRAFTRGTREEYIERRFVPTFAKIDQKLVSTSKEAAAARTVRAFVIAEPHEYDHRMLLAQLAAWVLPSASADLGPADGSPRLNVSNNLFHALDNAWTPANSFTLFQTGRAHLMHPATSPRRASETPFATYFGAWLGFTSVRDTTYRQQVRYTPTGERLSIGDPIFRQGGIGTPFEDILDAGITLFDRETLGVTDLDFTNIDDLFIQLGLDMSRQNALRRVTTEETSRYKLVPHLSFNGNITGGEHVLRYYAGAIFRDETNAYVGADYTLNTESGWNGYARVELYSEPDQDYGSEAELRASRTFTMSPTRAFTFGVSGIAALDARPDRRTDERRFALGEGDQRVDVIGRWREGPVDVSLRQRFASEDGVEWSESTTVGVSYAPNGRFFVSAQVTPYSSEESYLEGSVALNWRMTEAANAPSLQVQYARAKYDLGTGTFGDKMIASENIFQLGFQAKF